MAVDLNDFITLPFKPAPGLTSGHLMTVAPLLIPRQYPLLDASTEPVQVEIDAQNRIVGFLHRPGKTLMSSGKTSLRRNSVVVSVHGLESSAEAHYVRGLSEKALAAGFSVFRMNLRNCEGSLENSHTLYNAGLSGDVLAVVELLKDKFAFERIYLCGFSLGGNIVLKSAGELGLRQSRLIDGVAAVSPAADLDSCVRAIETGFNKLYETNFLLGLKAKVRAKSKFFPGRYDLKQLGAVKTLREFDNYFTAPDAGYADSASYYFGASAVRVTEHIAVPGLIIAAEDDPMVPVDSVRSEAVSKNPNLKLLTPLWGGHVGFIGRDKLSLQDLRDFGKPKNRSIENGCLRDRFWGEWQVLSFLLACEGV